MDKVSLPDLYWLSRKIERRYKGIAVSGIRFTETDGGVIQQSIEYYGPIRLLIKYDLLTEAMLRWHNDGRRAASKWTWIGDGYALFVEEDNATLWIFTGTEPRERPRIDVTTAKALLRKIAKGKPLHRN